MWVYQRLNPPSLTKQSPNTPGLAAFSKDWGVLWRRTVDAVDIFFGGWCSKRRLVDGYYDYITWYNDYIYIYQGNIPIFVYWAYLGDDQIPWTRGILFLTSMFRDDRGFEHRLLPVSMSDFTLLNREKCGLNRWNLTVGLDLGVWTYDKIHWTPGFMTKYDKLWIYNKNVHWTWFLAIFIWH